ncbi:hypothetical protein [Helicobacter turcicus]|uniref:Uncharacterized protein n=1 Tax=Helicobacter turcicus TaxID=2867412 RepID=A0ABS7JPB2_9HELI|nr:hypothetical protein [Helicobacter turcicus]MBX7491210.1 hypothetical protein [Helicobacter turcicus]MBX7546151.1 hypothetical protein [Helicobacter turcicus]
MKKILTLILLSLNLLLANTQQSTQGSYSATTQAELAKIFPRDDAIVENEACSWKCRDTNAGYYTQISGFDFKNGITYCRVYEQTNLDEALIYNANKQNMQCTKDIYKSLDYSKINNIISLANSKQKLSSQIKYEPKENEITLSQFLSSLVTLNPNIIDREKTNQLGQLTLKDNMKLTTTKTILEEAELKLSGLIGNGTESQTNFIRRLAGKTWQSITDLSLDGFYDNDNNLFEDKYQETSAVDGFNKNNMAYFSDLFMNMEKVYQHLQILLFVVVGGFYISSIGANKLQIYLENRGESASNQPYLHKFYIPLIMVGTFFMPIPEANGTAHSTMVQNTIRYFTTESTKIADMASAIGGKTYMDKIYKSIGGINESGIRALAQDISVANYKATQAEIIYKNTCSRRYEKPKSTSETIGYLKLTDKQKEELLEASKQDRQNIAGSEYDITLEACIYLEQEINGAKKLIKQKEQFLIDIQKYFQNNKLQNTINSMDAYFAIRENQLGWINSLITPSSAILAEMITFADASISKTDMETATKKNIENNKRAIENKDLEITDNEIPNGITGFIAGRAVWLLMPGASTLKDLIYNSLESIQEGLSTINKTSHIAFLSSSIINKILDIAKAPLSYYFTSVLIENATQKIPLLVCATASIVAFVSYLVSLCKYFYISPFVVCFSMATKRMNKIVDFLVSGISIFFKPILIVLFIYLALFVHTLISEIFVFISIEQFTAIDTNFYNFLINFTANAIVGMLKIFGILASSYIMWKLIVSGPSWALNLVGIDGKQDDMISQGIEANLARRAFVV